MRNVVLGAGAALCSLAIGVGARAEDLDPALPVHVAVGVPGSPAPIDRIDRERTQRSLVPLPEDPVETGRRSIGSFPGAPIGAPDGGLYIALASPELLRLDSNGEEVFRVRLGPAPALRSPVLLPNGNVAVLTGAPSVVFVSPLGRVLSVVPLPRSSFGVQNPAMGLGEGFASIAPNLDGSIAVAAMRTFLEIEPSGAVRSTSTLPDSIAADLVADDGAWLAVLTNGGVVRMRPPALPKRVGSFPGPIASPAARIDGRTLLAQVASSRLLSLDLKTGATVVRVAERGFTSFDAPFAVDSRGAFHVTTSDGFLVTYDGAGGELSRAPVDRNAALAVAPPLGRFPAPPPPGPRAVVLVDSVGNVAFARPGGRFGVRAADGRVALGSERACQTPAAIVPTAEDRVVLAFREGTLVFFGERGAERPAP